MEAVNTLGFHPRDCGFEPRTLYDAVPRKGSAGSMSRVTPEVYVGAAPAAERRRFVNREGQCWPLTWVLLAAQRVSLLTKSHGESGTWRIGLVEVTSGSQPEGESSILSCAALVDDA